MNTTLRLAVASNPLCPGHLLEMLTQDPEAEIRAAVAANTAAVPQIEAFIRG